MPPISDRLDMRLLRGSLDQFGMMLAIGVMVSVVNSRDTVPGIVLGNSAAAARQDAHKALCLTTSPLFIPTILEIAKAGRPQWKQSMPISRAPTYPR